MPLLMFPEGVNVCILRRCTLPKSLLIYPRLRGDEHIGKNFDRLQRAGDDSGFVWYPSVQSSLF